MFVDYKYTIFHTKTHVTLSLSSIIIDQTKTRIIHNTTITITVVLPVNQVEKKNTKKKNMGFMICNAYKQATYQHHQPPLPFLLCHQIYKYRWRQSGGKVWNMVGPENNEPPRTSCTLPYVVGRIISVFLGQLVDLYINHMA